MKKNKIFNFTTPNGSEVTAVVISVIRDDRDDKWYLCYAQNRLFDYRIIAGFEHPITSTWVDYAILPDYDAMLENYYNQHEENVKTVQGFGYTEAEANNILNGKNADGTDFEPLSF